MELLRRALLIGCLLPGLWLLRLAPLDPLLSVVPVDFATQQKREAASVPDDRKTEAERRRALLPLSVYIEESLQYNVHPASGPEWDRLLHQIDALSRGDAAQNELGWRVSRDLSDPGGRYVFFGMDEAPIRDVVDRLAAGGGTTYVSISRPGGDAHYRVDRRTWTRDDFRLGAGFTGRPAPPVWLLHPFRVLGLGLVLAGLAFFGLLPDSTGPGLGRSRRLWELAALGLGLLCFVAPLIATGGSAQALNRGLWLTIPCWILAAAGVHVFAGPTRNAPDPLAAPSASSRGPFLRQGLTFLAMAFGPLAFLIAASLTLWNR